MTNLGRYTHYVIYLNLYSCLENETSYNIDGCIFFIAFLILAPIIFFSTDLNHKRQCHITSSQSRPNVLWSVTYSQCSKWETLHLSREITWSWNQDFLSSRSWDNFSKEDSEKRLKFLTWTYFSKEIEQGTQRYDFWNQPPEMFCKKRPETLLKRRL